MVIFHSYVSLPEGITHDLRSIFWVKSRDTETSVHTGWTASKVGVSRSNFGKKRYLLGSWRVQRILWTHIGFSSGPVPPTTLEKRGKYMEMHFPTGLLSRSGQDRTSQSHSASPHVSVKIGDRGSFDVQVTGWNWYQTLMSTSLQLQRIEELSSNTCDEDSTAIPAWTSFSTVSTTCKWCGELW